MAIPALAEVEARAHEGSLFPITEELLLDTETPVSTALKLRTLGEPSFLLESVEGGEHIARYSFLGVEPFLEFRARGRRVTVRDLRTGEVRRSEGDPLGELRRLLAAHRAAPQHGLPRFRGGAVGYIGYDAVRLLEAIPDTTDDDLGVDDIALSFFDRVLAFDNLTHKAVLLANVHTDGTDGPLRIALDRAVERLDALRAALETSAPDAPLPAFPIPQIRSNMERTQYEAMVRRAKEYIVAGDIFQVVLAQRFAARVPARPFDIYRALRVVNPSPYMFAIHLGDLDLIGASPELLVRVEDGIVGVRPIAGTRRRGATPEEDDALARELSADKKELAEHLMLLDLGRNDVGRVSEYGSVRVNERMIVEHYSHVMHLVSDVTGRLAPDCTPIEALWAGFPAGTVSGAPKVRAMEIIDELEPTRRGPYAGAVGYIDFSGNLDTCIAIRTMVFKDGVAYITAGAGIVADSDPAREHEECVNKARALFRAIEIAAAGTFRPAGRRSPEVGVAP